MLVLLLVRREMLSFGRRNDPISSVRQAAEIALGKMKNVEEARQCIKVTQILSDEMSLLKPKQ